MAERQRQHQLAELLAAAILDHIAEISMLDRKNGIVILHYNPAMRKVRVQVMVKPTPEAA